MSDPFLDLAEQNIAKLNAQRPTDHDQQLIKVVRLAPTLAVSRALLNGETVPRTALDPDWLKAYGL